jgi:hypothetical protein
MARLTLVGTAITVVLCAPSLARAADYYIDSVAGADTNAGTSTSAPWASLTKAPSGSGNTIHLKRGSSWTASNFMMLSNQTYTTYGTGARPTINGSVMINNSVVEGLLFKPTTGNGINVNSNNTVRDCEVDGSNGTSVNVGFGIMGQNNEFAVLGQHEYVGWR